MTGSGKVVFTSLLGDSWGGLVFTNFLVTQFGQGHALFVRPHIVYTFWLAWAFEKSIETKSWRVAITSGGVLTLLVHAAFL